MLLRTRVQHSQKNIFRHSLHPSHFRYRLLEASPRENRPRIAKVEVKVLKLVVLNEHSADFILPIKMLWFGPSDHPISPAPVGIGVVFVTLFTRGLLLVLSAKRSLRRAKVAFLEGRTNNKKSNALGRLNRERLDMILGILWMIIPCRLHNVFQEDEIRIGLAMDIQAKPDLLICCEFAVAGRRDDVGRANRSKKEGNGSRGKFHGGNKRGDRKNKELLVC